MAMMNLVFCGATLNKASFQWVVSVGEDTNAIKIRMMQAMLLILSKRKIGISRYSNYILKTMGIKIQVLTLLGLKHNI